MRGLNRAVAGPLSEEVSSLYIAQTQIRLFLIEVAPISVEQKAAITFAHQNRLDQMNRQAQVMDAFRKIEVAADALQSQLNVNGQIGIGTDPTAITLIDSTLPQYLSRRCSIRWPLNRLNERNAYRASQIAYQQSSRNYTAGKMSSPMKSERLFAKSSCAASISRSQDNNWWQRRAKSIKRRSIFERTQSSTNLTRDLLQSLQELLAAKNNLISNWIDYKIIKIRIYTSWNYSIWMRMGPGSTKITDLEQLKDWISGDDYFPHEVADLSTTGADPQSQSPDRNCPRRNRPRSSR